MPVKFILNGIMLNEKPRIPRFVGSLGKNIDAISFSDTGSTDGSISTLQDLAKDLGLPCKVYQDKWTNFEVNRTSSLRHCEDYVFNELDPVPVEPMTEDEWNSKVTQWYVLYMDCDNQLAKGDARKKAHNVDLPGKDYDLRSEPIKQTQKILVDMTCGPTIYDYSWGHFLDRTGECLYSWKEPLHEYLSADGWDDNSTTKRLKGCYVISGRDGARSQVTQKVKFVRDYVVFWNYLRKNPSDERAWYYGAQSARDAFLYPEAYAMFLQRTKMGSYMDEVYRSHIECARIARDHLAPKDKNLYLYHMAAAHEINPHRFEAPYHIANEFFQQEQYHTTWNFLQQIAFTEHPEGALFSDSEIIKWQLFALAGKTAYEVGNRHEAQTLLKKILNLPGIPQQDMNSIKYYLRLAQATIHQNK